MWFMVCHKLWFIQVSFFWYIESTLLTAIGCLKREIAISRQCQPYRSQQALLKSSTENLDQFYFDRKMWPKLSSEKRRIRNALMRFQSKSLYARLSPGESTWHTLEIRTKMDGKMANVRLVPLQHNDNNIVTNCDSQYIGKGKRYPKDIGVLATLAAYLIFTRR